jgi:uncharacterized protein with HEPN domain
LDILRAARRAVALKRGIRNRSFVHDEISQSAIVHQLLVLGEATKRLSAEFRAHHPEMPWRMMAGMRDTLIYEYDEVDLEDIWKTVSVDLPRMIA